VKFLAVMLSGLALASTVLAREPGLGEFRAVQESLSHMPAKFHAEWLQKHGLDASRYTEYHRPESTGLRLIGKYGRGPSVEVMAQDTIMALTLGSECALLSIANPDKPRVLNEIQLDYLPRQSLLSGSLLLTGGNGIQIWDIANPSQPVRLSEIPYAIGDFSIVDTFLYFAGNDTFFAYSFANPASPRRIGLCIDSGYVTSATRNTAVLIQPNDVLGFVDVSDPAHPHQVGIWPAWPLAATARGNLCCAAFADPSNQFRSWFLTLDISNPSNPRQIARLDSVCGFDIFLSETLAFVSGRDDAYEEFCIVNIADSTRPKRLGACPVWNDNWAVWADLPRHRAYIASEPSGLAVVDITDLNAPHVDTCVMTADQAEDVWIDGDRAYVADWRGCLRVLDVSNPARPDELGGLDSVNVASSTAAARDSFAYVGWAQPPFLRTVDVSDPAHPKTAGGCDIWDWPGDMVLRDSFLYVAQRLRFQVVNVARPREPVLVGSCVLSGYSGDLALVDTIAYLSGPVLSVVNVSKPDSPLVVGTWSRGVSGLDVVDTILYAVGQNAQFWTLSVANPTTPRPLDSIHLPSYDGEDVVVIGSTAYASENVIRIIDVSDPSNLQLIGQARVPYWTPRLVYAAPYLYACCADGGVCVLETVPTGVAELKPARPRGRQLALSPSVTAGRLTVNVPAVSGSSGLTVYDVTGKEVLRLQAPAQRNGLTERWPVDLSRLSTGIYVIRLDGNGVSQIGKVVLTRR
jgi:hypothetical protein